MANWPSSRLTTSARSLHSRQNARRTEMTCTAMNILFRTSTLASSAEYEPAFIAVRPFRRGITPTAATGHAVGLHPLVEARSVRQVRPLQHHTGCFFSPASPHRSSILHWLTMRTKVNSSAMPRHGLSENVRGKRRLPASRRIPTAASPLQLRRGSFSAIRLRTAASPSPIE